MLNMVATVALLLHEAAGPAAGSSHRRAKACSVNSAPQAVKALEAAGAVVARQETEAGAGLEQLAAADHAEAAV